MSELGVQPSGCTPRSRLVAGLLGICLFVVLVLAACGARAPKTAVGAPIAIDADRVFGTKWKLTSSTDCTTLSTMPYGHCTFSTTGRQGQPIELKFSCAEMKDVTTWSAQMDRPLPPASTYVTVAAVGERATLRRDKKVIEGLYYFVRGRSCVVRMTGTADLPNDQAVNVYSGFARLVTR